MSDTWEVVATVDEPPALVLAFAAWHLEQGAARINLYFDRPDDPAAALLEEHPRIKIVRCDDVQWGGRRSERHQVRQRRNATRCYADLQSDWLLHCDADEFVRCRMGRGPIGEELAEVSRHFDAVRLPVAERLWPWRQSVRTVFAGPFRRPFRGDFNEGLARYGAAYGLTKRGLVGHTLGKTFTRRGRAKDISIHRASLQTPGDIPEIRSRSLDLLHFDGLTPLHWVYKFMRKAYALDGRGGLEPAPHHGAILDLIAETPREALALHRELKAARPELLSLLGEDGLLDTCRFDPSPVIARQFPGVEVDLTPGGFDRWLWSEKSEILRMFPLPYKLRPSKR